MNDLVIPTDSIAVAAEKYFALCKAMREALADAHTKIDIDRVANIAELVELLAKQACNRNLEAEAVDLRLCADFKLADLLKLQKIAVGVNKGGRPKTGLSANPVSQVPTLIDYGFGKYDAHKLRKYAEMPNRERNALRERTKLRIESRGAVLVRGAQPSKPKRKTVNQELADLQAKLADSEERRAGAEAFVDRLAQILEVVRDTAGDDVWHDLLITFPDLNHLLGNDGAERDQWDAKVGGWLAMIEQGKEPDPAEVLAALTSAKQ